MTFSFVDKSAKIFIAGHKGLAGSAIQRRLELGGYRNLLVRTRQELDLLDQQAVFAFLDSEKPDYVVIAAARVGGIMANNIYRGDFIYENLVIEANLIHGSWRAGIRNLLFLGSSCIYPKHAPQPMPESSLLTGELEYTNEPYAIAKIAGIKLCESYNLQYGTNYLSVMPTNLYGPNDNFDLQNSHVLPAMLRKFHLGKCLMVGDWAALRKDLYKRPINGISGSAREQDILSVLAQFGISSVQINDATVTLWGSGAPRREFLYSDDLADACVYIMENVRFSDTYQKGDREIRNTHINIGTGKDLSIRELAQVIMRVVAYSGSVVFDQTKPDGTFRKLQNVDKLKNLGWSYSVELNEGISRVYMNYCA